MAARLGVSVWPGKPVGCGSSPGVDVQPVGIIIGI